VKRRLKEDRELGKEEMRKAIGSLKDGKAIEIDGTSSEEVRRGKIEWA